MPCDYNRRYCFRIITLLWMFFCAADVVVSSFLETRALRPTQQYIASSLVKLNRHAASLQVSKKDLESPASDETDVTSVLPSSPLTAEALKKQQQQRDFGKLWKQAKEAEKIISDYTYNFLYVGISCLILLNLCGYAYTITPKEGLNVMTIQRFQKEWQWKVEIQRQQSETLGRDVSREAL